MKPWLNWCIAILSLVACTPENHTQNGDENTSLDPEFTVTGLPESAVEAYSTFTLTVTSKSEGSIGFESDRPDVAAITLSAKRQYKVRAKAPEKETEVTVTFVQKAKGKYPEVKKEVKFTVLPEPTDNGTTVPDETHPDLSGVKVTFTETTSPVTNPERGHYRARNIYGDSEPLKASEVKAQRASGYSLWYLGFYLTDFMKGDISQDFLDTFQACMDALREGGSKCVLRFAYRDYHNDKDEMDPEVSVVLNHVKQLKPYLQANEDVIFVLQAGFVGAWGEWYYTSHFGFDPKTDADYKPRKDLTDALLDALPQSRQVQLRTPQFKMRMYGKSVADTLTAATAHDGSPESRLAGHNDCFGKSSDDSGTFGNESKDREFWKAESRYTIMGGETCGVSDYCTCAASERDLADYHWTYLNKDYHSDVLNRWKSSGCYNRIVAKLGYRLVLVDLFHDQKFTAGTSDVTLRFYNTGYAAPMNPREAILVWETPSGSREETELGSDPRTWQPGFHTVTATFNHSTAKGTLYLKLSDPLLADRPEYSIAFANEGVFDTATGLNRLFEIK